MPIKPLVSCWIHNRLDRKDQIGYLQGIKNKDIYHEKFFKKWCELLKKKKLISSL
jgi:hypothetical protein